MVIRYSRAPISEAVIDVRVEFVTLPTVKMLQEFADSLKDRFPHRQPVNTVAVNLAPSENSPSLVSSSSSTQIGLRLSNANNDRVAQVLTHGLVYSHLPPYSDWEAFTSEFRSIWDRFVLELGASRVTRVAVRYINRLQVPNGGKVEDYLSLGVKVPDAVTSKLIGYFAQLVMPLEDLGQGYRAVVNTGVEPGPPSAAATLLLDIDAFLEGDVPLSDESVWGVLQKLRRRKNAIFEASITDLVREMIK